jgi:hypothetical protein
LTVQNNRCIILIQLLSAALILFTNCRVPTTARDWLYHEESFDKFYYIARKEVMDTAIETDWVYSVETSVIQMKNFHQNFFPKHSTLCGKYTAYAIYKSNELISSFNDYPFPIHLTRKQTEQPSYTRITLVFSLGNLTVVVAKAQTGWKQLPYLPIYFVYFCLWVPCSLHPIFCNFRPFQLEKHLQLPFPHQAHSTIIGISIFI